MKRIILLLFILPHCIRAQVTLQTGSAVFNLPVFSWQDNKSKLNSLVALNYSSENGLKVNDIATNIGQGWNLIAGGVITRMQVGEPDDQMPYEGTGGLGIHKYPAGYLYNDQVTNGVPKEISYYPVFSEPNQLYKPHNVLKADTELDYFSFQFNGRTGTFVLGKNNGYKGYVIGDSKLKVWYDPPVENMQTPDNIGIRTTINVFYIKDEKGIVYKFSKHELSKVLKRHNSEPGLSAPIPDQELENFGKSYDTNFDEIPNSANPYIITGWYLSEISDPFTNRIITFNYIERDITSSAGNQISFSRTRLVAATEEECYAIAQNDKYYINISHSISKIRTQAISSIVTADNHLVKFEYETTQRFDLPGDYPLKNISIHYNGNLINRYLLTSSYFILNQYGIPVSDVQKKQARLCLKEVQKFGTDSKTKEPPYVFDYYLGSTAPGDFVPPPFYYLTDIAGYYNGNRRNEIYANANFTEYDDENNIVRNHSYQNILFFNTTVAPDNESQLFALNPVQLMSLTYYSLMYPECVNFSNCIEGPINPGVSPTAAVTTFKDGYAKNGLLKSIVYPLGGKLEYKYAQNVTVSGGVRVSATIESDDGYSNAESTSPIITLYKYVESNGASSLRGEETPVNAIVNRYYFPGENAHAGTLSEDNSISISKKNDFDLGGLISAVTKFKSVIGYINDIKTFIDNPLAFDPSSLLFKIGMKIFMSHMDNNPLTPLGQTTLTTFNNNFVSNNPYPVLAKRVEVLKVVNPVIGNTGHISSEGTTLGRTVYEITSDLDYPFWDENFGGNPDYREQIYYHPYSKKQRAAPWAYGLIKKITNYDRNNVKVSETENVYDWSASKVKHIIGSDRSYNAFVRNTIPIPYDVTILPPFPPITDWLDLSNPANLHYTTEDVTEYIDQPQNDCWKNSKIINLEAYDIYSGRVELTDQYNRIYKKDDDTKFQETHTRFEYNPDNFEVRKTITVLSNGDEKIQETYYTQDYAIPGHITELLKNNNVVNTPVASYNAVKKQGSSTPVYVAGNVIDYAFAANGDYRPSRTLTGLAATPVTTFSFNPNSVYNYPNIQDNQTHFYYDAQSNLIGQSDEGGRTITNIYDYDDKFIVATVTNADPQGDHCAYTSFETGNFGKWTPTLDPGLNSPPYVAGTFITGNRSFDLNNNSLLSPDLNTAKSYKLSYWSSSTINISVTNGTAVSVAQAPLINGFTYYEFDISAGATKVSLSGNSLVDELRLYPKSARMKTVSYNPIIGKTSECDENNHVIYYEYDFLGRLKSLRNEKKDIIKMYEYNYKH